MLVSAGENIQGYKIVEYKDIVFGVGSSIEGGSFRQLALKKMTDNATKLGANAVTNFKMEIYPTNESIIEATAYGNAVIADPVDGVVKTEAQQHKVNLEAYARKPKSSTPEGQIYDVNGYKFVVCPQCGTKYKVETNENGKIHIKGFEDVDDEEPGLQVFCLRCGVKFTVPET
jgi:uncharacterized protein YbjQ (UPF0145 family)